MVSACTVASFYCTKRTVLAWFWVCSNGRHYPNLIFMFRWVVFSVWVCWNADTVDLKVEMWVLYEWAGVSIYFLWTRFCAKTLTDWHAGKYHSLIVYLMCFSICALFLCRFKHRIGIRMLRVQKWCSIVCCSVLFLNNCQDGILTRCM